MNIYLYQDGKKEWPYKIETISKMIASSTISLNDWAWYDGCKDWIPVSSIHGITNYIDSIKNIPYQTNQNNGKDISKIPSQFLTSTPSSIILLLVLALILFAIFVKINVDEVSQFRNRNNYLILPKGELEKKVLNIVIENLDEEGLKSDVQNVSLTKCNKHQYKGIVTFSTKDECSIEVIIDKNSLLYTLGRRGLE